VTDGTWSSRCLEPDSQCPTSCSDLPGRSGTACYDCDSTVKPVCDSRKQRYYRPL